jgi:Flp pilus assembly protein CpaB
VRTPIAKRSKVTLALGFAVFLAGSCGAAYLGSRGATESKRADAEARILTATRAVDSGTAASTALAQGALREKKVPRTSRPANAVGDPADLAGRVSARPIAAGEVITADMFAAPQTRVGTVVIPPGKRALALQLAPLPAVAGFAGAGDHVDVYGVIKGQDGAVPAVHLVLQGVEVLSVNGTGLPSAQGQPPGPDFVYLLAVTPTEAERLIYLSEFEKLYFDLVAKGEPPVATPGTGPAQALQAL